MKRLEVLLFVGRSAAVRAIAAKLGWASLRRDPVGLVILSW